MRFQVTDTYQPPKPTPETAYLVADDWNDWREWHTQFSLAYCDSRGILHHVGTVKISEFGLLPAPIGGKPRLPTTFVALEEEFFSLGQEDTYYENLTRLGAEVRDGILAGLHDIVREDELLRRALVEESTRRSLMRFVTHATITMQFRRIALGGARLTKFQFAYTPAPEVLDGLSTVPPQLEFRVEPNSQPPTNIHVLIGSNAVGKTHLLQYMTRAVLGGDSTDDAKIGTYTLTSEGDDAARFANVVSVSFSAFDQFEPIGERAVSPGEVGYRYIGLRKVPRSKDADRRTLAPKDPSFFAREFGMSLKEVLGGPAEARWRRALSILAADPIFSAAGALELSDAADELEERILGERARALFADLSSGHKVVMLTMTRLAELVEEKTLVVIDEPESHLHPPLLSAFVRALSELLTDRNGVAVIATHSPVVLQEVPSRCVYTLRRSGRALKASRPQIETFGENVGVLTHEAFGLQVKQAGFHKLLSDEVEGGWTYDEIVSRMGGRLGGEARAILQGLIAIRDRRARP